MGQNINSVERITNPEDIRFPWGILYLYKTFTEEDFDVSIHTLEFKLLILLQENWRLAGGLQSERKKYPYRSRG